MKKPDPAYKSWGLDSKECSWYLDNLQKCEKYKERVIKDNERGRPPPSQEDFFGPHGCSMIQRIKMRKKVFYKPDFFCFLSLSKNS